MEGDVSFDLGAPPANEPKRVSVPDRTIYEADLDCYMHTGANAVEMGALFKQGHLATDIETPGLERQFEINCVTMAWEVQGKTHTILLDPRRNPKHAVLIRDMYARASMIILHNAPFDLPALYDADLIGRGEITKVVDTLLLARFGLPDTLQKKSLGALGKAYLGMDDNAEGMKLAFKAAGFKTIQAGYEGMDIDSPIYRQGAMLDTVATLRLQRLLREHCWAWSMNHPFETYGATTLGEAEALLEVPERVHRLMLWHTARGIRVDTDYLNTYAEKVNQKRILAEAELALHGLEGGSGKGKALVEYLHSIGELPAGWPRTGKTRALSSAKAHLEALDHPLAAAQRTLAEIDKVMVYLRKVTHQASVTGRCHPQVGTLAASATGRMSYAMPELQQFPKDARPVLVSDNPDAEANHQVAEVAPGKFGHACIGPGQQLWSIDWSQIEPVTMGTLAKDEAFLAPYEAGDDLYEPLMRAAGIDRPTAKIVLLADMYGQGEAGMAMRIGASMEQAAQIRRQVRAAMKQSTRWMSQVQDIAANYGKIVTGGGRILPVDKGGIFRAVNYCLDPGTLILRADLTHVPAFSVQVGDELVGFDEFPQRGPDHDRKYRALRTAVVEAVSEVEKPTVIVKASNGVDTACSTDHLWLVRTAKQPHRGSTVQWVAADQLRPGDELLSLGTWGTDTSRTGGYLAGLLDGEASMSRAVDRQKYRSMQLHFAQVAGPVMDAYRKGMEERGLPYRHQPRGATSTSPTDGAITSGVANVMRVVGTLRPERFVARSKEIYEGRYATAGLTASVEVEAVVPAPPRRLTSIQTSTRTLVANGFLSHNCVQGTAADVLMHAIVEIDRAGLGDTIRLAMHDELVLDATEDQSIEIERIMRTAPPFMEKWLGRPPLLRTDRDPMGEPWLKV